MGHDFRPDYLNPGAVVRAIGRPPTLALTATASPDVRRENVDRLGMEHPRVVVRGLAGGRASADQIGDVAALLRRG